MNFTDDDEDIDRESPCGCGLLALLVAFTLTARWLVQPDTRPSITGGNA